MRIGKTIYLDYQATTPVDPLVFEAMMPHFLTQFGNPHSSEHIMGWKADESVQTAKAKISGLIAADSDEIIFTSGATESNNLALFGLAGRCSSKRNKVMLSAIEHKSVIAVASQLHKKFDVECLTIPVNREGVVDTDFIADNLDDSVMVISIIGVNNEIGTIQALADIGGVAHRHGALFHCDAAQAPCAIDINVLDMNIDLLSLSAHKIYGPKGIGALYIKREHLDKIEPQIYGGGQQNTIRSGTLPVPLCVGFGKAAEILSSENTGYERKRIAMLRNRFVDSLVELEWQIASNGPEYRLRHPGNANLLFKGFSAPDILSALQPDIAASTGSACTSGTTEPSYVLRATGLSDDEANSSIRFSFGRFTSVNDIDDAVKKINETLSELNEDRF
jgi:cysteine desulfurase